MKKNISLDETDEPAPRLIALHSANPDSTVWFLPLEKERRRRAPLFSTID
ncbi:hypothetical protein ABFB09_06740 [Dehalogenimonas sp. THU2]